MFATYTKLFALMTIGCDILFIAIVVIVIIVCSLLWIITRKGPTNIRLYENE